MRTALSWLACLCTSMTALAALPPTPVNGFSIIAIIPLPGVNGRIDHLAYDPIDQTVFIAELENKAVEAVNVSTRKVERRLTGFDEPQGIAWSKSLGLLYVASGDGKVKSFRGAGLAPDKTVDIGSDADNIRLDEAVQRLYVGHGDGGIAVLDARTLAHVGEMPVRAHPEGFQLWPTDGRIFVNVPKANEIAILDRVRVKQVGQWPNGASKANYPLAIDAAGGRVITVFRQPARIVSWDVARGKVSVDQPTCNDADDVFVDERRQRIYVVCGEGFVDVLSNPALQRIARLPTTSGARTGLYRADADRLFIAARANGAANAALWVLAPAP